MKKNNGGEIRRERRGEDMRLRGTIAFIHGKDERKLVVHSGRKVNENGREISTR